MIEVSLGCLHVQHIIAITECPCGLSLDIDTPGASMLVICAANETVCVMIVQEEVAEVRQKLRVSQQEAKAAQERALNATAAKKDQAASDQLKLQVSLSLSACPLC